MDFFVYIFKFGNYTTVLGILGIFISGLVLLSTPKDEPEKQLIFSNKKEFMIFSILGMLSTFFISIQTLAYYLVWHIPEIVNIEEALDTGLSGYKAILFYIVKNYGQFFFPVLLGVIFYEFFKRFSKRHK